MSLREVADRYGVCVSRVRAWIKAGELVAIDVSRKAGSRKPRYIVTPDALAGFERARSTRPAAKQRRRRVEVTQYV